MAINCHIELTFVLSRARQQIKINHEYPLLYPEENLTINYEYHLKHWLEVDSFHTATSGFFT